jgi:hypothetical protein
MQVSHSACRQISKPGKLLILTHSVEPQATHSASVTQTAGHSSAMAEIDGAKAAMMRRTKRIVYDLCDMGSGNSKKIVRRRSAFMYSAECRSLKFSCTWLCHHIYNISRSCQLRSDINLMNNQSRKGPRCVFIRSLVHCTTYKPISAIQQGQQSLVLHCVTISTVLDRIPYASESYLKFANRTKITPTPVTPPMCSWRRDDQLSSLLAIVTHTSMRQCQQPM